MAAGTVNIRYRKFIQAGTVDATPSGVYVEFQGTFDLAPHVVATSHTTDPAYVTSIAPGSFSVTAPTGLESVPVEWVAVSVG